MKNSENMRNRSESFLAPQWDMNECPPHAKERLSADFLLMSSGLGKLTPFGVYNIYIGLVGRAHPRSHAAGLAWHARHHQRSAKLAITVRGAGGEDDRK